MNREEIIKAVVEEIERLNPGGLEPVVKQCDATCISCGRCVQDYPKGVEAVIDAGASRISATQGTKPSVASLARYIDHTLLKPEATKDEIIKLCEEAKEYRFASVCVNPVWVPICAERLRGTDVGVCAVIGFPLGANKPETKAFEAEQAIRDGATELDMVINIGALKSGMTKFVEEDISRVVEVAKPKGALVKVIIETALLTDEEKVKASFIAKLAGADFVKTSTGFSKGGATVEDVALMRRVVGSEVGVKASGGIKDPKTLLAMISSGATRIGASASVKIMKELGGERAEIGT